MYSSNPMRGPMGQDSVDMASTATLAPSGSMEDDDLYSFDKRAPGPSTYLSDAGPGTRAGIMGTSFGMPQTAFRMGTGRAGDGGGGPGARPMTSVRAAGYSSRGRPGMAPGQNFDPMNQGRTASAGGVSGYHKLEEPPEEQIRNLERKVTLLVEESTLAAQDGNLRLALEKAKEAGKKERALSRHREQVELGDQMNLDLTYCVLFNLANQYQANQMYQEALNTFSVIVKNKLFNQSGRLRVNMGNIYFAQKKYSQAVKMYRMALDQVSNANKEIRLKIMRNIGNAFIRMGQFQDAITSFEAIMEGTPDYHSGFNLILCYFALGDKERMKRWLQRLVAVKLPAVEMGEDFEGSRGDPESGGEAIEDHEVFNEDDLRDIARKRRQASERYIILAAKLVAPSIENTFSTGYDWITDLLKNSSHAAIASDIEIAKALQYLKAKEFSQAIETLKSFEKTDQKIMATAATNLSFMYFLDGDLKQAEKYADVAIQSDRYNAKALTNRGNCYFSRGNLDKAREFYHEAVGVDAVCTEAMYNIGLVNKKLGHYSDALRWFEKLYAILRNSAEVIFQIADIHDKQGNHSQCLEWFNILISVVPTDPGVLARLGAVLSPTDKSQAFQYYSESYRYYPSAMDVIAWLGAYYVECQVYEQAVQFFERASIIQPAEVKWQLMVASCFRRSGNYQASLEMYKKVHERFPDNVECLRFLVRICTDLGLKQVHEYAEKLTRVERAKEQRAAATGASETSGSSRTADPYVSSTPTASARVRGGTYLSDEPGSGTGSAGSIPRASVSFAPSGASRSGRDDDALGQSARSVRSGGMGDMGEVEKIDPNLPKRPQTSLRRTADDDDWQGENVDNLLPE